MRSLNNQKKIAPLTLDVFQLPQNSNAPKMRLNTPLFQTSRPMFSDKHYMGAQMGANAFAF
jgi:hypothetical protein